MVDGYFTEATKRELKKIAGGLCSKCECATEGGKSIGQAAHIKDRRKGPPGGLRFDSDMTDAQRADVTNGIWLCGNCHPPIDNGTEQLTVLELQTLKQTRARKALEQKGEKYPTHEDVLKPLQIVLGATAKIRESAISNIHQAVEHTYVQLDSRFDIQTQYSNGRSILQVTPNSHVELSFSIDNESSEFKDRLRSFKDYGTSLEIIDEITVKGSTLMEGTTSTSHVIEFEIGFC